MSEPIMISVNVRWLSSTALEHIIASYRKANRVGYISDDDAEAIEAPCRRQSLLNATD